VRTHRGDGPDSLTDRALRRTLGAVRLDTSPAARRALERAVRTRAAVQRSTARVWPLWLDRQADPSSSSWVPGGELPLVTNLVHRNWTAVGTLDGASLATVDPAGLVTPERDGWSLDWWIGADDRWHVPSREVAVRQRLVGASPVVETSMGIPSGDAVHRTFGVQRSSAEGGGHAVVVEVENGSPVPVALAFAVRPYTPEGASAVERIDLRGTTVLVDGRVVLLLPRPPARTAGGAAELGDVAATVMAGEAGEAWRGPVHDPAGQAQAAFVYPLAHGATLRVVLPLDVPASGRRRSRRARGAAADPGVSEALPPAVTVAGGWQSQSDRGLRLSLPDERLANLVDASRRFLLLLHGGDTIAPGPAGDVPGDVRSTAGLLGALGRCGFVDEVAGVLHGLFDRQRSDGRFDDDDPGAGGAALVALADHWRLTRDTALVDRVVEPVARAAHAIDKARAGGSGRGRGAVDDPQVAGLLPARRRARLGATEHLYADSLWGVAGLHAAADVLAAVDQPEAAEDARRFATAFWSDIEASLARVAVRLGGPALPAAPARPVDAGAVDALDAVDPLGLLDASDARVAATAEALRARWTLAEGRALWHPSGDSGAGPAATLRLASVELRAGDHRALDRLAWIAEVASPTSTWPEAVHPRLGTGSLGDGHDGRVAAALVTFVRDLLVREVPVGDRRPTVALSTLVPADWFGHGWEVHGAPTAHGTVSYAVRWHGDRVALLWEVETHDGLPAVRLVAPGLDPDWSTDERSGEALLGPVPVPPESGDGPDVAGGLGDRAPARSGGAGPGTPVPEGDSFR
jgi:hypothetical protein